MSKRPYPSDPILVIDDEEAILLSVDTTLQLAGMNNVLTCADSRQVMAIINQRPPSVILLDLNMPHIDGEAILEQITNQNPHIPVIIITGRIDAETAVECMKSGAFDYIVKPVDENRLIASVKKSIQYGALHQENQALKEQLREGQPETPRSIYQNHHQFTENAAPVQLRRIRRKDFGAGTYPGRDRYRKRVDCQGHSSDQRQLPENLSQSMLQALTTMSSPTPCLAMSKGRSPAPTPIDSASSKKPHHGTLFLDEIGDLSPISQIKLLRLLQEKEYMPLGRDTNKTSSARIVASTHVDLWDLQQKEMFRQDLHYRLRTHRIILPPLRERKEDLGVLVDHFVQCAAETLKKKRPRIPEELIILLESYSFPGNIRELQAMVFDAIAQNDNGILSLGVFRQHISRTQQDETKHHTRDPKNGIPITFADPLPTIKQATRMLVEEAMHRAGNNQTTAASLLGISQQALSKRLKNLEKPD